MLVVYLAFKCFKKKSNWFTKKVTNLDKKLRYESTSRFIVEISMSLSISIMINLFYGNTDETIDIMSYFIAIILFSIITILIIYTVVFPVIYFAKI